jgi:preprotein translocase subunit YajC
MERGVAGHRFWHFLDETAPKTMVRTECLHCAGLVRMRSPMSLLITPAFAQDAAQNAGPLGGLGQFATVLPIVMVFAVFYFLLMRPQQQRQKKLKATLAALRRGDRVVTAGGIIGVVQKSREGTAEVEVEIAPGVRVLVLRDTISSVLGDTPPAANDSEPEKRLTKP